MEVLNQCPICSHNNFEPFIVCKDHTVSHEVFSIVKCTNCDFKFTNPRPLVEGISKYYDSPEYISHSNTSRGIVNMLYQRIRKYTVGKKVDLISDLLSKGEEKTILDMGCGTGEFLNACKNAGWKTMGVEPGESARNYANENYYLDVQAEQKLYSLPDKEYSIVTLWHVLEHVHHLNERILELKRLLTDNGTLIIAVPNSDSKDATQYKEYWAAYDVPRHLYHFAQKNIKELMVKHGMKVVGVLPMRFDAYYVSLLSEKYKNPSALNYFNAFLSGYCSNRWAKIHGTADYSSVIYIIKKG